MIYFVHMTVLFWHFYPQIYVLCFTVAVCQLLNKEMMMMMIAIVWIQLQVSYDGAEQR